MTATAVPCLTTPRFLDATGITRRQLEYWTCTGQLHTVSDPRPGSGRPRVYPASEVVIARRMRALASVGVTPGRAAQIARGGSLAAGVEVTFDDDQLAKAGAA